MWTPPAATTWQSARTVPRRPRPVDIGPSIERKNEIGTRVPRRTSSSHGSSGPATEARPRSTRTLRSRTNPPTVIRYPMLRLPTQPSSEGAAKLLPYLDLLLLLWLLRVFTVVMNVSLDVRVDVRVSVADHSLVVCLTLTQSLTHDHNKEHDKPSTFTQCDDLLCTCPCTCARTCTCVWACPFSCLCSLLLFLVVVSSAKPRLFFSDFTSGIATRPFVRHSRCVSKLSGLAQSCTVPSRMCCTVYD